jgi:hypothetical protein
VAAAIAAFTLIRRARAGEAPVGAADDEVLVLAAV